MENQQPVSVLVVDLHPGSVIAPDRLTQALGELLGLPSGEAPNAEWQALDQQVLALCERTRLSLSPIPATTFGHLAAQGELSWAAAHLRTCKDPHEARDRVGCFMASTLPFWHETWVSSGHVPRYLLVLDDPGTWAATMEERTGLAPEHAHLLWAARLQQVLTSVPLSNLRMVARERLQKDPEACLSALCRWLGRTPEPIRLAEAASRVSIATPSAAPVPEAIAALHQQALAMADALEREDRSTLDTLVAQWSDAWAPRAALLTLIDQQQARLDLLQQATLSHHEDTATLQRVLREGEQTITALQQQVAQLEQTVGARSRDLNTLQSWLDGMQQSRSWRLTAPLRHASDQAARVKRLVRLVPTAVARGGGLGRTLRKAAHVFYREGWRGVRIRLRMVSAMASAAPALSAPTAPATVATAPDRFAIVPYYVNPLLDQQALPAPQGLSIAVHLHLFHVEMLDDMAQRLAALPCAFDLFVSVPQDADHAALQGRLTDLLPRAGQIVVEPVPNRGRDLAPMVVQFGARLSNYAIVGHFHTKRSPHNRKLSGWCEELLDHLLGPIGNGGGRLVHFFEALQQRAKFIYPEGRTEFIKDRSGWADNLGLARDLLERHTQLSIDDFPVVEFPEGAMFWARGACLRPLLSLPLSFRDFPAEPIAPDGTLAHALERLILVLASPFDGVCLRLHRGDSIPDHRHHEARIDFRPTLRHRDIKVLSYYLPQFHPIPENDAWHGQGFTEWTKVRAANPLFVGHYQQHIPHPDLGYYLLDGPDTLRKQADLMHQAGVHGQVFYHYWFGGKLILEDPARTLLAHPDIDMPFCFCWANENWTRRWDGNESEILLAQNYSADDARAFIRYLIPFFKDPRHLRVENRPVLFVYRPSSIPEPQTYLNAWAEVCRAEGLEPPYVVAVLTRGATHPADFGMDAGVERVLHDWTAGGAPEIKGSLTPYAPINGSVLSYEDVARHYCHQTAQPDFTYFRSLVPIWDNTARYGSEAYVVHGSTPERFQAWMEHLIQHAQQTLPEDRRFILVNAWNEWAEGAHLEPDSRYGYSYLNAVGRALSGMAYDATRLPANPIPPERRLHLSFPPHLRRMMQDDATLAHRFMDQLARSSIFSRCQVSLDAGIKLPVPLDVPGEAHDADWVLEIRRLAFFGPQVIERLVQMAVCHPTSVVVPNSYQGDHPLVEVTRNGSVTPFDAHEAALVLYPVVVPEGGLRNFRMRTDAPCFVARPNTLPPSDLPVVTTIIRFHAGGDLELLRNALDSLAAMHNCIVVPWVAAQDLSEEQLRTLEALLLAYPGHPGHPAQIHTFRSPDGRGDLRSKMLNESLRQLQTRYVAFLDHDDLMMGHAYEWLIERLQTTGKGVAFGRVYATSYDGGTGQLLKRNRVYEYGHSYDEFIRLNHAPLHSFLLDLFRVDVSRLVYHEDQRFMEDYFMTLQLFTRDNADWESLRLNRYVGDYIHSVDRAHTLAFTDDAERSALLHSPEYMRCEDRINELRATLIS